MMKLTRLLIALIMSVLVCAASLGAWRWHAVAYDPPSAVVTGVAYQPWRGHRGPGREREATQQDVEADMAALAAIGVKQVRTYSSLGADAYVAKAAHRHGMRVLQGVWIGKDLDRRRAEIEAGLILAKEPNVVGLIVGSEAIMRRDIVDRDLIPYLREVRSRTTKPVGSAETWGDWASRPFLAKEVDFAVVHILPFWERASPQEALGFVQYALSHVMVSLPGTRIVVGETGWPTNGAPAWRSPVGISEQADFVRRYFAWANRMGIESHVMEAFDGPWKVRIEGSIGPYWGIFDAYRNLKFPLAGPLPDEAIRFWAAAGIAKLGLLSLLISFVATSWSWRGLAFASFLGSAFGYWLGWVLAAVFGRYFILSDAVVWSLSAVFLTVLIVLLIAELSEAGGVIDRGRNAQRLHLIDHDIKLIDVPVVSVHVPTHAEPPGMVIQSLEALASLDWPRDRLEVIVLDNNTSEPALWRPVEEACARLNTQLGGEIFRFFHLDGVKGFKAGALDEALARTRRDVSVVAVIDADYVVAPSWLQAAVPLLMSDPRCAFVQAPQDHRDKDADAFRRFVGPEYDGFFGIGMIERARDQALILHGTMVVLRRSALESVGGWRARTITEDAELGLRLQASGWTSRYIRETLGCGLLPDDMAAIKAQRQRWAYGGARIVVEYAGLIFGRSANSMRLTMRQRLRWLAGWAPWAGEALAVIFAILSAVWTLLFVAMPDGPFQIPEPPQYALMLMAMVLKLTVICWLRRMRVPSTWKETGRALVAGLALAPIQGAAFLHGLVAPGLPFRRTAKGSDVRDGHLRTALRPVRIESVAFGVLVLLGALTVWRHSYGPWGLLWAVALWVQALPYGAAMLVALSIRRPRTNLASTSERREGAVQRQSLTPA